MGEVGMRGGYCMTHCEIIFGVSKEDYVYIICFCYCGLTRWGKMVRYTIHHYMSPVLNQCTVFTTKEEFTTETCSS